MQIIMHESNDVHMQGLLFITAAAPRINTRDAVPFFGLFLPVEKIRHSAFKGIVQRKVRWVEMF